MRAFWAWFEGVLGHFPGFWAHLDRFLGVLGSFWAVMRIFVPIFEGFGDFKAISGWFEEVLGG